MVVSEFAFLSALIILCTRWYAAAADRRRTELLIITYFCAIPATAFVELLAHRLLLLLEHFEKLMGWDSAVRYDLYIYKLVQAVGFPNFMLGRMTAGSQALTFVVTQVYGMAILAPVAVFTVYAYLRRSEKGKVVKIFILNVLAAMPFYLLIPVSGPKYAFPTFPRAPGPVAAHPITLAAIPNGIPSVHTSTALLCAAFLWPWKWGKVAGSLFVALTVLATLANGEHYVFDLLCAVPYTWLVWNLGDAELWGRRSERRVFRLWRPAAAAAK